MDPCQHPCLSVLPLNYLKAIKGLAGQVDAFLGKLAPTYIIVQLTTERFNTENVDGLIKQFQIGKSHYKF